MSNPSSSSLSLTTAQRTRLDQISSKFSAAWNASGLQGSVYISQFLPTKEDQLYRAALEQLIRVDLEFRRRRGEGILLEQYLADIPELGPAESLPVELIAHEYRLRRRFGESTTLDDYRDRFPTQFEQLKKQIGDEPVIELAETARATMVASAAPLPIRSNDRVLSGSKGYRLIECIGRGAFGEVWRGEAPGGVEVAVKMIHRGAANRLTEMELQSLELIKRLRHPFLMQVHAFWFADEQLCIVMDLADQTLLDRFENCRGEKLPGVPVEELLGYMHEAAEALDYLHSENVIHRDVKPANVLLVNGHARIADFGLARLVSPNSSDMRATTVGTPLYMGPEVWDGRISPAGDQYSLAAAYVELRLGRPLFDAQNQADVRRDHKTKAVALPELSKAERKVLERALAKEPEKRYPSCKEFVDELDKAIHGGASGGMGESLQTLLKALAQIFLVLAGIVAVGGIGFALWKYMPRPQPWSITTPPLVEISPGEQKEFSIYCNGTGLPKEPKIVFTNLPEGVTFQAEQLADDKTTASKGRVWNVSGAASLALNDFQYGQLFDAVVRVEGSGKSVESTLKIRVPEPPMILPPEFVPAPKAQRVRVEAEKANYWNRIVRRLPNKVTLSSEMRVEFVLIPANETAKLSSFYMMENKVWNELFAAFAANDEQALEAAKDETLWPADWKTRGAARGADDMPADSFPLHPVMNVNHDQATACAKWLGGRLPSYQQWDVAAGFYSHTTATGTGPFHGTWDDLTTPLDIAVQRAESGTLAVGSAKDDISPSGCRDMAGNGAEWTSDRSEGQFATVVLRGRRYDKRRPLLYADLSDRDKQSQAEREDPAANSAFIGFRVVVEPRAMKAE